MSRADISDKVVHFTGPRDNWNEAFARLQSIMGERTIRAGNNKIRSGDHCVCFTEAPLNSLPGGLVNPKNFSRYAPFGLVFDKKWIFENGGRPVIYQPESEFSQLRESHKWRHVRYEPNTAQPIDFTWEREWRIKSQGFVFQPSEVVILVPRQEWLDALRSQHETQQKGVASVLRAIATRFCSPPLALKPRSPVIHHSSARPSEWNELCARGYSVAESACLHPDDLTTRSLS